MILSALSVATGAPTVAYAMYEGERLLFSDPLYAAHMGGGEARLSYVSVARRVCPFHIGERSLALHLCLLDASENDVSPDASVLLEAENRFLSFLQSLQRAERLPFTPFLLPRAISVLRESADTLGMHRVTVRTEGERVLFPVRARQSVLLASLGFLLSVCGRFGDSALTLSDDGVTGSVRLSLPLRVEEPILALLAELARVGGFSCSVAEREVTLSMPHMMAAVALREEDDAASRAFLCGALALSAPSERTAAV